VGELRLARKQQAWQGPEVYRERADEREGTHELAAVPRQPGPAGSCANKRISIVVQLPQACKLGTSPVEWLFTQLRCEDERQYLRIS